MNPQLTDEPKRSNPWKSALVCLGASIAGAAYGTTIMVSSIQKFDPNRIYKKDELIALFAPATSNFMTVIGPILGVALIAGILNIVSVVKGGRKWPLVISFAGILIALITIGVFAIIWMKIHGES